MSSSRTANARDAFPRPVERGAYHHMPDVERQSEAQLAATAQAAAQRARRETGYLLNHDPTGNENQNTH
jgi:hypothetical protein